MVKPDAAAASNLGEMTFSYPTSRVAVRAPRLEVAVEAVAGVLDISVEDSGSEDQGCEVCWTAWRRDNEV